MSNVKFPTRTIQQGDWDALLRAIDRLVKDIGYDLDQKLIQNTQAHIIDADGNLADITTKFNTLLSQLETAEILESS